MKNLDAIAIACGTDKSSERHYYTRYYQTHIGHLEDKEIKVLEIGVHLGYSLSMWSQYFSNALIYGIDIEHLQHLSKGNVTVLQGDQNDPEFLRELSRMYGPFDLIVDDGSHHNVHMRTSFDTLFPLLTPKGIYVVEDLYCCYWTDLYGTGLPRFTDYLLELIDALHCRGKTDYVNQDKPFVPSYTEHLGERTEMEKIINAIHLYRGIAFIHKN